MSEFVEFLKEVFVKFGAIKPRKMFGGYGLYFDDVMFALVADEVLYLKADASIAHYFIAKGLTQFSYNKDDKTIRMSYYLAPEEIYDDADIAADWARRSFAVALRTKKHKKKP